MPARREGPGYTAGAILGISDAQSGGGQPAGDVDDLDVGSEATRITVA